MEMDNVKQHESLLRQIHDTYIKKNHDYGDSFSRSYKKYGLVAAMVRMEDKWNRFDNMASGAEQKVADEISDDCGKKDEEIKSLKKQNNQLMDKNASLKEQLEHEQCRLHQTTEQGELEKLRIAVDVLSCRLAEYQKER